MSVAHRTPGCHQGLSLERAGRALEGTVMHADQHRAEGAGAALGPSVFVWKSPATQERGGTSDATTLVVPEFLGVSMFHQLSASLETGWETEAGSLA